MTSPATVPCPFCESEIGSEAKKCRFCGEWVARSCESCGTPVRAEWAARGLCAECQARRALQAVPDVPVALARQRSRGTAIASAFLLGGVGAHKFYLGKPGQGTLYLMFFWTFIPMVLALIEGVNLAVMSDDEFHRRYSG